MNKKTIEIQEDDLHAYVDQQLSAEKIEAVETLMRENPEVALQVQQWQQQNKAIKELMDNESFTNVPERLDIKKLSSKQSNNETKSHHTQRRPWVNTMAASVLMLISGALGWFAHGISKPAQNTASFVNSAISAHQVFSAEVLHPVEVSAEQKDHLVAWLSKRIDHSLKVPELQEYGFNLLGGRLLSMQKGKPAAQLMFEDNKGQRITWLISKNASYHDKAFLSKKEKNVNSFYWMDSKVAYSVTSSINREELRKLSKNIYQQINNKTPKQIASL